MNAIECYAMKDLLKDILESLDVHRLQNNPWDLFLCQPQSHTSY